MRLLRQRCVGGSISDLARTSIHAPIDVTGAADLLERLPSALPAVGDDAVRQIVAALSCRWLANPRDRQRHFAKYPAAAELVKCAPFAAVASTCLVSQLLRQVYEACGPSVGSRYAMGLLARSAPGEADAPPGNPTR